MSEKKKTDKTPEPEIKDVEPGSDAAPTPAPEPGKTPKDPNKVED